MIKNKLIETNGIITYVLIFVNTYPKFCWFCYIYIFFYDNFMTKKSSSILLEKSPKYIDFSNFFNTLVLLMDVPKSNGRPQVHPSPYYKFVTSLLQAC